MFTMNVLSLPTITSYPSSLYEKHNSKLKVSISNVQQSEVVKCKKCAKVIGKPAIHILGQTVVSVIIMTIFLEGFFKDFCSYLEGKLSWTETKDKEWTKCVLNFFKEKNKAETIPFIERTNHMDVDYIWRYSPNNYSFSDIELAVEHEGQEKDINVLLTEEIQHLIDLKANHKVGIFYISLGDEKEFIEKIKRMIAYQLPTNQTTNERYLIILGYTVRKAGKKSILFKGFFFDGKGEIEKHIEQTILQQSSSATHP